MKLLKKLQNIDKKTQRFLIIWFLLIAVLLVACFLVPSSGEHENIKDLMKDAVLHDVNKVSLLGLIDVNPSLISGLIVTAILLILAVILRVFFIPKFKIIPTSRLQIVLEQGVGLFYDMAKSNSPWRYGFLGAYIFCTGVYIFFGTLFELFGVQVISTTGAPIVLPAPLADVNSAIMMGLLSYFVIFVGAVTSNGLSGLGSALKEISLVISMPLRLFGALLSGLLVTELCYYYVTTSYGLPVVVAVMFTLLHAIIQTYVLTLLTSMFYGEKTEPKDYVHH